MLRADVIASLMLRFPKIEGAITNRFAADSPALLAAQPDLVAGSYNEFA